MHSTKDDHDDAHIRLAGPLYGLPPLEKPLAPQSSISSTRTAVDAAVSTLNKELSKLYAIRNDTLPINHLPNEILVEILVLCTMPPHARQLSNKSTIQASLFWIPLRLVCRRWWAIAQVTPCLWRVVHIHSKINLKWFKLVLSRTQNSTIELEISDAQKAVRLSPATLSVANRISKLVFPHSFCVQDAKDVVAALLAQPMHHLELLDLTPTTRGEETPFIDLSFDTVPERWPALRHLRLADVTISTLSLAQPLFSNVRELELRNCAFQPPRRSFSSFLDLLLSCPSLEFLGLTNILSTGVDNSASEPSRTLPPVSLPRLKELIIVDLPALTRRFLTCVDTPVVTSITVTGLVAEIIDSTVSFYSILPKDRSPLSPFLRTAISAVISPMDGLTLEVDTHDGKYIYLELQSRQRFLEDREAYLSRGLGELPSLFGVNTRLEELHIRGNIDDVDEGHWTTLLESLPALTYLNISCLRSVRTNDLFRALSRPSPSCDAAAALPVCPMLKTLRISGAEWSDSMVYLILRCAHYRASEGKGLGKLELHLQTGEDDEDYDAAMAKECAAAIREVLGGVLDFEVKCGLERL